MAVEGRTLDVQYGNTKPYYTVTNLDIDASLLGFKMPLRLWLNTTGTATYTAAAKAILFPNQYAHPVKVGLTTNLGVLNTPKLNMYFKADGTTIYSETDLSGTGSDLIVYRNIDVQNITNDILATITKNSVLTLTLTQASTGLLIAGCLGAENRAYDATPGIKTTMYFNRWHVQALPGIKATSNETNSQANALPYNSITVSNSNPWDYDEVTFNVSLAANGVFKGWYSDAECTQLVSPLESYTTRITADTTLYAYTDFAEHAINIVEDSNVKDTSVTPHQEGTSNYTFTANYDPNVTFLGWYSDAEKKKPISMEKIFSQEVQQDTTIYTDSVKLEYEVYQGDKRIKENYIGDYKFS